MKKIIAAAAVLSTLPFVLTGCGENDEPDATGKEHFEDYDYGHNADHRDDMEDNGNNSAEDFAHDAVDGAQSAADDVIDGAGDAANDIIDGLDGERNTDAATENHRDTATTSTEKADR